MKENARLYEPAEPLWHIGNGRMLFAGCLHRNALHSHSAPVLLEGLYDDFELKIGDAAWFFCRMAVIRAGTALNSIPRAGRWPPSMLNPMLLRSRESPPLSVRRAKSPVR